MNLQHNMIDTETNTHFDPNEPQLVFVYGTLKRFQRAHDLLSDSQFVGVCSIPGVLVHLGGFPGLVPHSVCRATGEVFSVNWNVMKRLDQYESAPTFYSRRRVTTPFGAAWTYYKNGVDPLTDQTIVVDRGVWTDGRTDRCSYAAVLDYFTNKRWNEPKYRVGPQPIIPAEVTKTHEQQIKDGELAEAVVPTKVVNLLEHKKQKDEEFKPVSLKVGPGTDTL